jgi:hypothetical protein
VLSTVAAPGVAVTLCVAQDAVGAVLATFAAPWLAVCPTTAHTVATAAEGAEIELVAPDAGTLQAE